MLTDAPSHPKTTLPNDVATERLASANPRLIDVAPAGEVIPGLPRNVVLTSGPTQPWQAYTGGQRTAILGSVVYEGLASDLTTAEAALNAGTVTVKGCQEYQCVGSLAGVTSGSMPVLVVEDGDGGPRSYCTLFEGETPHRLNYGVWNDEVAANLRFLSGTIAPALRAAVLRTGPIPLLPIMQRALRQGDELHSRNTAASLLLLRELLPALVGGKRNATELVTYLTSGDYFFLRPAMAAAKLLANRMHGVAGSSIVTSMAMSCTEFGIRVSGLGDRWFTGPLPIFEHYKLTGNHTIADAQFMGGESIITETAGLGAFAQTAAFTLQDYQGGIEAMVTLNRQMYEITHTESTLFTLPFLDFRGTPTGIDVHLVAEKGITPVIDIGIAGVRGGQIGAGTARVPLQPFRDASAALQQSL